MYRVFCVLKCIVIKKKNGMQGEGKQVILLNLNRCFWDAYHKEFVF